jgi:hypothetical protein
LGYRGCTPENPGITENAKRFVQIAISIFSEKKQDMTMNNDEIIKELLKVVDFRKLTSLSKLPVRTD